MFLRLILVSIISLFLAGCQTTAQQEGKAFVSNLDNTVKITTDLNDTFDAEFPEFRKLTKEIGLVTENQAAPTIEQRMDDTFITDEEGEILLEGLKNYEDISRRIVEVEMATLPVQYQGKYFNAATTLKMNLDTNYMELLTRKITKGEAATKSMQYKTIFQQKMQEIFTAYDFDLTQRHNQQVQARSQALQQMGENLQRQQQIYNQQYNQNRPWYMNCNTFGTMTNCTTY